MSGLYALFLLLLWLGFLVWLCPRATAGACGQRSRIWQLSACSCCCCRCHWPTRSSGRCR